MVSRGGFCLRSWQKIQNCLCCLNVYVRIFLMIKWKKDHSQEACAFWMWSMSWWFQVVSLTWVSWGSYLRLSLVVQAPTRVAHVGGRVQVCTVQWAWISFTSFLFLPVNSPCSNPGYSVMSLLPWLQRYHPMSAVSVTSLFQLLRQ